MGKTSAVIRLGYVHLRVTDLEEARNHYSNTLGMEVVHEEPGKLWLKCWDEWDHHSLVLTEGGVGLVKFGYKVEDADALADFERRAQQFGATTGRFSAGENLKVGDGVRITMPRRASTRVRRAINSMASGCSVTIVSPVIAHSAHAR